MSKIDVYLAKIPNDLPVLSSQPKLREEELQSCCDKVKREKTYSWSLLISAIEKRYGELSKDFEFTKAENGKWLCNGCCFSITHSKGYVAVAVSDAPVGIDMESESREITKIQKTLTLLEQKEFENSIDKNFLLKKWTQKESLYKKCGVSAFNPFKIETVGEHFVTKTVAATDENFIIPVACDKGDEILFYNNGV